MDLLTRIEASLEFMNDGGPIRVDFVNLREVLEGSREALLKLDAAETREKGLRRKLEIVEEYATSRLCSDHQGKWSRDRCVMCELERAESRLGAVEDELRHSVSVMSIVRSWLLENVRGSTHWENCEREHATCRAISQLGGVVERLSRLNLTAGVVERTVTNEETQ